MPWWKKALIGIGGALALLIAAGFTYQTIAAANGSRLRPPASEMVSVNGHKFHFFCMGNGPRTFILDAGHGSWSFAWWHIQPLLAKTGRACAFDRAGRGWSDWVDGGYDGLSAAAQLHAIVRAAHVSTPFIYVGHSYGANLALIYAGRYPKDISALILLDPGNPRSMLAKFHGTRADAMTAPDCAASCYLVTAAAHLGVTRLMTRSAGAHTLPGGLREQLRAGLARPATAHATMASWTDFPKTAFETEDVRSIGDTPLLMILSSSHAGQSDPCRGACVTRIRSLSTQSAAPVVIPNSTHISFVGGAQAPLTAAAIIAFAKTLPSQ